MMREILAKYFKGDGVIWGVVILLSLFSLLAVYSSTGSLAYQSQDASTATYILKHFSLLVLSLVIIFIIHNIPYKYYSKLSQLFVVIALVLLLLTLLMGTSVNQAKRWLTLPGIGLTIQTSDFAKLALVMYIARILSVKQYKIGDSREVLGYLFIPTIIICGLILPANLSTALILFATVMILLFIGRVRMKYILGFVGIGIVLLGMLIGGIMLTGKEGRIATWQSRIEHFMDGEEAENYQVEKSKIAIATGGILGKGPGNSTQRDFLPFAYSDFIYAIIVEEYGFVGGLVILFLYLFLLYRAGVIVKRSTRTFGAFLSIGLALLLVIQALINMAVTVHLIPVTGQTLPFVSMGGSSLLFTSIAIGIILSVSRSVGDEPANKKKKERKDE
ncbi:MAG: FtsW/RodA/SpoVE family cell cycle protein [Bacteroidales bacterium]|nr:FtsW/RodA/SpoVE family cell cycle protein [Bacteroidales bacterium]